jgi:hypothetical protein
MVFKHGRLCWSILLLRQCDERWRCRWTGGSGVMRGDTTKEAQEGHGETVSL